MTLQSDYTVEQVAEALQVSARWVRKQVAEGTAPHYRAGHKLRFTAAHVEALRRNLEVVAVDQPITATRRRRAS